MTEPVPEAPLDLEAVERFAGNLLTTFTDSWESFTIGADELIDAGEHVVMPFTNVARGRDGIEVQARGIWVWTLRDGACVRITLYQERGKPSKPPGRRSRHAVTAPGRSTRVGLAHG